MFGAKRIDRPNRVGLIAQAESHVAIRHFAKAVCVVRSVMIGAQRTDQRRDVARIVPLELVVRADIEFYFCLGSIISSANSARPSGSSQSSGRLLISGND